MDAAAVDMDDEDDVHQAGAPPLGPVITGNPGRRIPSVAHIGICQIADRHNFSEQCIQELLDLIRNPERARELGHLPSTVASLNGAIVQASPAFPGSGSPLIVANAQSTYRRHFRSSLIHVRSRTTLTTYNSVLLKKLPCSYFKLAL
jgi:hypothetical protein